MPLASALSSSSSTSHSLQRQLKAIREEIDRDFTMRSATPPQALRSRSPRTTPSTGMGGTKMALGCTMSSAHDETPTPTCY